MKEELNRKVVKVLADNFDDDELRDLQDHVDFYLVCELAVILKKLMKKEEK